MSLRDDLQAARTNSERGALKATAAEKALKVLMPKKATSGLLVTSGSLSAVIYGLDVEGNTVRVYLDAAKSDAAALVIVNPPTLVADSDGDIDLLSGKHREDPAQALINVICEHGGFPTNPSRVIPQRVGGNRG